MPNFKPKANKKIKINKKSTITLDNKHQEKMKEFENIKNTKIPTIEDDLKKMKNRLRSEKNISIEEKLNLKDQIKELKKKKRGLEKQEKNYYLDNSKYIFEYFESKKKVSKGSKKKPTIF